MTMMSRDLMMRAEFDAGWESRDVRRRISECFKRA
ncbi:MAG: hypothetical protein JWQ07_5596 [Ramlibacter sp.]|nr:hypothetical protein [Ramlibacter sp.]